MADLASNSNAREPDDSPEVGAKRLLQRGIMSRRRFRYE
jgi:hypothetical protein